jgi:hypothetical protein
MTDNSLCNSILQNLININSNSSSYEYQWFVEAVCINPEITDGFYATLGYFKTESLAEEYCVKLTEDSQTDFITFRYKKIGEFGDFVGNKNNKIVLTTDKKLNNHILNQEKQEKIEREKMKIKNELIEKFETQIYEEGSLAQLSQLIYTCHKNFNLMNLHSKSSKIYESSSSKLNKIFIDNPNLIEEWKPYMKVLLSQVGESHIYTNLEEFILKFFDYDIV